MGARLEQQMNRKRSNFFFNFWVANLFKFILGIINSKTNGEEQTPLHYAARYDSVEAMKVLIQAGAMIDEVDFIQRTPLQVAAEIGTIFTLYFRFSCFILLFIIFIFTFY